MRVGGGILPKLIGQDERLTYDEGRPNKITKSQYHAYLVTLKLNLQTLLDTEKNTKAKTSIERPLLRSNVTILMQKRVDTNHTVSIQQHATILKAQIEL